MTALPDPRVWRGRRVVVTGHSGFKGGWLALWLAELGAEVHGLGAPPPCARGVYELAAVREALAGEHTVDVRDEPAVAGALRAIAPEIVLHLAAQAIVRHSFDDPATTWAVNVGGTVNVLKALPDGVRAVLVVTSDKCYRDVGGGRRMQEDDPLGATTDPYSASKAAQELVAASFRRSTLAERGIALATARAGNVIGGGDCAAHRLVPDIVRAARAGAPLIVRRPDAVRPWQHVLNPLSGYLVLTERLLEGRAAEAWNFGPDAGDERPVGWLLERLAERWPDGIEVRVQPDDFGAKEEPVLRLDSGKAHAGLGWTPRWDLATAIDATVEWYAGDPADVTRRQIARFSGEPGHAA